MRFVIRAKESPGAHPQPPGLACGVSLGETAGLGALRHEGPACQCLGTSPRHPAFTKSAAVQPGLVSQSVLQDLCGGACSEERYA